MVFSLNTSNGVVLYLWLLGIVNSIVEMKEIPPSTFKLGSICPVYKGGGKDPEGPLSSPQTTADCTIFACCSQKTIGHYQNTGIM